VPTLARGRKIGTGDSVIGMGELEFRQAVPADAAAVRSLVTRAYRGEIGWTTESHLLTDERIDHDGVVAKITAPDGLVLLAMLDDRLIACCELHRRADATAYFGLFAVEPDLQAGGIGRRVLAEAERTAVRRWRSTVMEMQVVGQRAELVDWYVRRGYRLTDRRLPFPYDELVNGVALRRDLYFAVLTKVLD
jgi:GNAT superfamily N-acetyltransferase